MCRIFGSIVNYTEFVEKYVFSDFPDFAFFDFLDVVRRFWAKYGVPQGSGGV